MYKPCLTTFLPETLKEIAGKTEKEKITILLEKLALIAIVLDQVTAEEIHAITGAPMEECSKALGF